DAHGSDDGVARARDCSLVGHPRWSLSNVADLQRVPGGTSEDAVNAGRQQLEVRAMHLRPILSAMFRNKTGAILVGLQIALTLAVVANAVFIIMQRVEKIGRSPGIDSENLIFVQTYGYGPNYNHR